MKFKGTIGLAAAFLAIVLYYFFIEIPTAEKKRDARDRAAKILVFETGDVQELALTGKDQTLRLRRSPENEWEIIEPLKARADSPAVDSLVADLQGTRFSRVVEANPADLSTYGLKEPKLRISLKLKDQGTKTLAVGDPSPIGHSLYLKRDDEKRVLLAPQSPESWDKSLYDLRDKSVLSFATAKVTRVEIERTKDPIQFTRQEDHWMLTGTLNAKGDTAEIENLLTALANARAEAFVDEDPKDLSAYGLDPPALKVIIKSGGADPPQILLIGSRDGNKKYYAKTGDGKNIVAIGARVMDKLSRKPHEFLDKTLLDFEQDRVTELSLQTGDETLRLVRDGKGKDWNIKQPIETDADTATVNSLLFDLKDTRIVAYVNEAAKDLEAYGLEPPSRKLTLQAGKELALGFKTGNPTRDEKNLFAVRTGEAMVFILKKEAVDKIFRPLHDLRNKKLLRFSMDKVSKIKINYPETTFVLEKKDGGWSLLKPERLKKIKSFLAKDILWTLNNLEFEERVDPPVAPAESGLDHPAVSITLWEGDHSLGSVRVGAKTGSQYYAQAEGRPGLYKIKDRFLNEIPKDVKRFKDG